MPARPQTCSRGSGYTIQMIGSHKLSDVHRFTKANHLQGRVSVHRETLDGLPWYIIAYGNYPNVRLAHKAIKTLPQSLRSLRPWVKACRDFKK